MQREVSTTRTGRHGEYAFEVGLVLQAADHAAQRKGASKTEALAPFGAARLDDRAPAPCLHSYQETVRAGTADLRWLIGALHVASSRNNSLPRWHSVALSRNSGTVAPTRHALQARPAGSTATASAAALFKRVTPGHRRTTAASTQRAQKVPRFADLHPGAAPGKLRITAKMRLRVKRIVLARATGVFRVRSGICG